MAQEIAVIVIKPDAVRDILEPLLLRDILAETGVTVVWRKYWRFKEDDIPTIYPDWVHRKEFPAMSRNMLLGPALVLIVTGEDAVARIKRAKGKMNAGGLRLKYRRRSIEEWQQMGYEGEALQDKIAENRLHSTDMLEEAAQLCALCMRPSEREELKSTAPDLHRAMLNATALAPYR